MSKRRLKNLRRLFLISQKTQAGYICGHHHCATGNKTCHSHTPYNHEIYSNQIRYLVALSMIRNDDPNPPVFLLKLAKNLLLSLSINEKPALQL